MCTHVPRRFFPGTRLRHACDLMTDPGGSFLPLPLFWRQVLRAAQTPWELVADAPSLLRSSLPLPRPSFSGIVPAPGDAQPEWCPLLRAAVLDGGADFSFVQTMPPRDLVSLTVFRLLSDGREVSVAWSEMQRGSRMDVHRAAGTCGQPTRRCLAGGGERGGRGVGADREPAGITPQNSPNPAARNKLQMPEAERVTIRETRETRARLTITKLRKLNGKERIFFFPQPLHVVCGI